MITTIAFDADDTLWHNENLYSITQERFKRLLAPFQDVATIDQRLYATEMRNLAFFGYGIKGFTLSMIETAIEVTDGRIGAREIRQIIDFARDMLRAPVELLPGVRETIASLSDSYRLMIITKGDLFDQESKIARSGIADYFQHIEIVSEKTPDTYAAVMKRHGIEPHRFLMVGNSLKSDILPVVEVGGNAVYIPYHLTWEHERVIDEGAIAGRYATLSHISELPSWLARLPAV
ncbi:MAG: HAD family hydrolase [Roseiflexus sp.]|nr:HAD family hydrolase [Roseiflexus sp.]MCS7289815.1 HAD family hydrolase [Roseiflexus sp.]MDW8234600.1 HAD family hydrolase [Roseiflexaceae bacterium]